MPLTNCRINELNGERFKSTSSLHLERHVSPLHLKSNFNHFSELQKHRHDSTEDPFGDLTMHHASSISESSYRFSLLSSLNFETRSSFYPESYTSAEPLQDRLVVVAILDSTWKKGERNYFLTYAESPRRWRKVILTTIITDQKKSENLVMIPEYLDAARKTLPLEVHRMFSSLLDNVELSEPITKLRVHLKESQPKKLKVCAPGILVASNELERRRMDSKEILQRIRASHCHRFAESSIVIQTRIQASCYMVWNGSSICLEQMAPFANTSMSGDDGFQDFINGLEKFHLRLRGCPGVPELLGIVVDDAGQHIKGYLLECPKYTLRSLIGASLSTLEPFFPMLLREHVARELIRAVVEVHETGAKLGFLSQNHLMLTSDLRVVIKSPQMSNGSTLMLRKVHVPPELRLQQSASLNSAQDNRLLNFKTDIFQLGLVLWQILQQARGVRAILCAQSGCTQFPRHKCCIPDHREAIALPRCNPSVPEYFNTLIEQCRRTNPNDRPSAKQLLQALPPLPHHHGNNDCEVYRTAREACPILSPACLPPSIKEFLDRSSDMQAHFTPACDECGNYIPFKQASYRCESCFGGDFDICSRCYELGVRCWDNEDDFKPPEQRGYHNLVKEIRR